MCGFYSCLLGVYLFGGFCFCGVAIDGGCTVSFKISRSSHLCVREKFLNI